MGSWISSWVGVSGSRSTTSASVIALVVGGGRIRGYGKDFAPDATVAGGVGDFLLLAARREDADTLFFQRRLRMSGDTELGLYLKNFLDAFEPPARWAPLRGHSIAWRLRFPGR